MRWNSVRRVVSGCVLAGVLAGCVGGSDGSAVEVSSSTEVVVSTEIFRRDGLGRVRIGGLAFDVDLLTGYVGLSSDRNVLTPPSWPELTFYAETPDPERGQPGVTWVVFSRNEVVTDGERREELTRQFWEHRDAADREPVHQSTVSSETATCHTEWRRSPFGSALSNDAYVLFSGPGLASSAMVTLAGDDEKLAALLGDVVEAACGTRPDGL